MKTPALIVATQLKQIEDHRGHQPLQPIVVYREDGRRSYKHESLAHYVACLDAGTAE